MATNEKTSKVIAKLAARVLNGAWDTYNGADDYQDLLRVTYALAGSALTQAPDKPKTRAKAGKNDRRRLPRK